MTLEEELFAHLSKQQQGEQPTAHQHLSDLPVLRATCAALPQQQQQHALDAAAPIPPALSGCVELLAAALLSPPQDLFADPGGAPQSPEGAPCCRLSMGFDCRGRQGSSRDSQHLALLTPPPHTHTLLQTHPTRRHKKLLGGHSAAPPAAVCTAARIGSGAAAGRRE